MLKKESKILVNKEEIKDLLERGVSEIYPTKEKLEKLLLSGKKLKIYAGADATGPSIHLGHTKIFIMLEKLRKMGHEVIVLFGDFTAKIGDPTDKSAARVRLTNQEVKNNLKNWKKQISPIINLKDKKNPAKISFNSKWLSKLNFDDVVDLASNFTVQQMIERDMFQKRIKDGKPIFLHEFFYPIMQGYDSVCLDVDLEIGGTDQTFNMLTGRTLMSKLKNKEKFVLTVGLIEDPKTGKKLMSKSEGDAIWLDDSPDEMFGKVMSLQDEAIIPMLISTTLVETKRIEEIEKDLKNGINPKEAKIFLAKEIVKMYHGEKESEKSFNNFEKAFSKKTGLPENTPIIKIKKSTRLVDLLIENKFIKSKSEFNRLIIAGAIKDLKNGEKISDKDLKIESDIDLKIGKKVFVKIIL